MVAMGLGAPGSDQTWPSIQTAAHRRLAAAHENRTDGVQLTQHGQRYLRSTVSFYRAVATRYVPPFANPVQTAVVRHGVRWHSTGRCEERTCAELGMRNRFHQSSVNCREPASVLRLGWLARTMMWNKRRRLPGGVDGKSRVPLITGPYDSSDEGWPPKYCRHRSHWVRSS